MSKHTPGPWRVTPTGDIRSETVRQIVVGFVGDRWLTIGPEDERWANAHLIAASPIMLKALEYVLLECGTIGEVTEATFQRVKTAIAKAKGKKQNED